MISQKKFTTINEHFTCENCHREVPKASKGCRNHCPFCLHSKHLDVNPGDRASHCQGTLKPMGYFLRKKMEIYLQFQCTKCHMVRVNKANQDDRNEPDSLDEILGLPTLLNFRAPDL